MIRRHAISGLLAAAATAIVGREVSAAPADYQATYENFDGMGFIHATINADETLSASAMGERSLAVGFARIVKVSEPYVEDGFWYDGWYADPISLISAEPVETFLELSRFPLREWAGAADQGVRIYTVYLG